MFCFDLMERTRKNGGKKHGWEDVPCSRETTQVCNTTWPAEAFSYNQHAKSITFIPEDLRVTGLDSCIGQNRFREQQRAWVLLWELVHISMNSCSIRGYVNLHNKPPWEEWIYFCCYTYWIHAFLIYAEIWPAVYKRQPFCESSLDRGGTESTKLQPHTSSVLCPFFSVLWIKMLPSFSHSVYSLIHLPPSCWANMLVLNLPPLHNPSFFPLSVNHLLAYYTPSPHLSLSLLSFPLALFSIYPPLHYTFITRSVLFLLHHILTSLASTFPFFSSNKSNSIPHPPLSSLQYCGKRGKNQQIWTDKSIIR